MCRANRARPTSARRSRLRRSPHVLGYWRKGEFVVRNYLEGTVSVLESQALTVLHFFDRWRSFEALARGYPRALRPQLRRLVDFLIEQRCLLSRGSEEALRAKRACAWDDWSPVAGFFHFASRKIEINIPPDNPLEAGPEDIESRPKAIKRIRGARRFPLQRPDAVGELGDVLRARRTWRHFSRKALSPSELSTLLQLTWGVQRWAETNAGYRIPLKTSPSGGACHPIEVYVLALRVAGLERGLYHYDSSRHTLELLKPGASAAQVGRYIPGQPKFLSAAALFLMTAVFPRSQWRYRYPRAYRSVLLEVGHFCQTFCLVATSLGLAPFQTMLFDDAVVEEDMGVDGIDECFLYGAGVGHRPPGADWAP